METTLAVLSWGAHKTLINTLTLIETLGLSSKIEEKLIFFQEISESDIRIAKNFGYTYLGAAINTGIPFAYTALVATATKPYFLFLENDWALVNPNLSIFDSAKELLDIDLVDVVRLRSRKNPGNPLWTYQFKGKETSRPEHLLDCVHWEEHPNRFNGIWRTKQSGDIWYLAQAKNANWTNNPTLIKTDFIREHIIPRIGDKDIELDIQQWWQEQIFLVAQGEGLFTHNRIG